MISVSNITKSYGDLQVLKGINLEVKEKEIICIVGPSGAGKTTLLQIMGTLDRPDGGAIKYNNKEINNLAPKAISKFRNQEIGFVFQFHQLLPEFSAIENVCIPAYIAGKSRSEAEERASKLPLNGCLPGLINRGDSDGGLSKILNQKAATPCR